MDLLTKPAPPASLPLPEVLAACHLDIIYYRHHDVFMRTTLTLEEDLARKLKELARRRGISFKEAVNDSIRAGLRQGLKPERRDERFQVKPSHCGFVAGVDIGKINQLVDELEAADFVSETKKQ